MKCSYTKLYPPLTTLIGLTLLSIFSVHNYVSMRIKESSHHKYVDHNHTSTSSENLDTNYLAHNKTSQYTLHNYTKLCISFFSISPLIQNCTLDFLINKKKILIFFLFIRKLKSSSVQRSCSCKVYYMQRQGFPQKRMS